MTPRQQRPFVVLAIIIAVTRVAAMAESLVEWDEALCGSGDPRELGVRLDALTWAQAGRE